MKKRIEQALKALKTRRLDAYLVSRGTNCTYLSGFRGEAILILSPRRNFLVTSCLYREEAGELKGEFSLRIAGRGRSLLREAATTVRRLKAKRVGFEDSAFTFREYGQLRKLISAELVPGAGFVENLRRLKDRTEIRIIRQTARLARRAIDYARSLIQPGISEEEVRGEIESFISSLSGAHLAFPIIVASGPNAAQPHHRPGKRKICRGELVVIDLGVNYQGYNSDLTRTLFLGKISEQNKTILTLVLESQRLACSLIQPGVRISHLERQVRTFLAAQGWERFFIHSLGHGVGAEIHESPTISLANHDLLLPGMVITIEPGIYLPGKCGCRWEDMVLITKSGKEILS